MREVSLQGSESMAGWLCRMGGTASWILLAYCLVTMVQLIVLGGPPVTAEESFRILQDNRFVGLLRLDLLTVFAMPLYYILFLGLYAALRRTNLGAAAVSTGLVFIGVTLFLTTPSAFSLAYLSDQFASASTDVQRNAYLAAGEALIAADMWHGTAAVMAGLFVQVAGVLISVAMLQAGTFSKLAAYIGVVMFSLDLAHIVAGFVSADISFLLMATAGPLYLLWFPLVGRRLRQLGRIEPDTGSLVPGL